MSQLVVRRFEVHAAEDGLAAVDLTVQTAKQDGQLTDFALEPTPPRPASLRVKLKGEAEKVARVMERLYEKPVHILRDLVVPARDGAGDAEKPADGRGRLYPDPLPLLRIGAVQPSPSEALTAPREGTRPVRLAIVDSGVMLDHRDLRRHLRPELVGGPAIPRGRFIGGGVDEDVTDVTDEDGHGTMLAGTILATANHGLEGFTPDLQIIPVKFFDADTRPQGKNAARAIDFAMAQDPHIIELSWELGTDSREVHAAIGEACRAGKLVVFAAGNHGNNIDKIPAFPSHHAKDLCQYDGCEQDWSTRTVTVMASDRYDEPAWFSNYGRTRVDLAAPGVGVISTCRYHSKRAEAETPAGQSLRRCQFSGTSAASAHVAGAAALIWGLYPGLKAEQLKRCLVDSVEKRTGLRLRCASGGRLYLRGALRLAEAAAKGQVVSSRAS
jgi:hypothetical protein